MVHINKAQSISLVVVSTISSCISSVASLVLIISILRSNIKLSSVYRRLIFAMSAFELIQSLSQIVSSAPMPAGTTWGAIGNHTTCGMQGFFATLGLCGAVLYILSLSVYFLLVIRFNMQEVKIRKYAEPFLHAVPIIYSLTVSIYIYAVKNYNISLSYCWIESNPRNCEYDPEVECLNNGNTSTLRWLGAGFPIFGVFLLSSTLLAVIWWEYRKQMRKNQAHGRSFALPITSPSNQRDEGEAQSALWSCPLCPTNLFHCICMNSRKKNQRSSVLADHLSRPSRAATQRMKEITNRAIAFTCAFVLSFLFSLINRMVEMYGSGPAPFAIMLIARCLFPLQGFFNILAYTYPHVVSYRKNHSESNWFQAFWEVIKSGGDSDELRRGRQSRRNSIRKRQRVLEQSEQRSRMGSPMMPYSPRNFGQSIQAENRQFSDSSVVGIKLDSRFAEAKLPI